MLRSALPYNIRRSPHFLWVSTGDPAQVEPVPGCHQLALYVKSAEQGPLSRLQKSPGENAAPWVAHSSLTHLSQDGHVLGSPSFRPARDKAKGPSSVTTGTRPLWQYPFLRTDRRRPEQGYGGV